MKNFIIILFTILSVSLYGQRTKTTNSVVTFETVTTLDTILAGKHHVNILNTGSSNCLINGDTLRPTHSLNLDWFYDEYNRTSYTLPQLIVNAGVQAFDTLTLTGNAVDAETATINGRAYRFVDDLDPEATGTLTLTGAAANNDTVVLGANTYRYVTTLIDADVAATGTLTLTGSAANNDTVLIDDRSYRFVTTLIDTNATAKDTLTLTGSPINNQTVVIGTKTYTYKTVMGNSDGWVLIGSTDSISLLNLVKAINLTGRAGFEYGRKTTINTDVTATHESGLVMSVDAITGGTSGNSIAATETLTNGSWASATLLGGANTVADDVLIGANDSLSIVNLVKAIMQTGTAGTEYTTLTTVHATVTAAEGTGLTLDATAITDGVGGNSIATTETMTNGSWGGSTLSGGLTTIANDVKIGASDSLSIDNLMKAINLTGVAGTDYTTLTAIHPTVTSSQSNSTTLSIEAKTGGTGGNSIASTETMTNGSFGGATLSGGLDQVADDILIAGSASLTIDNFIDALNLTGTIGTDYGNGTVINADVGASALAGDLMLVKSLVAGTAANSYGATETMTNGSWSSATLLSGLDGELSILIID